MSYQNHVIDPTFFYDVIEEFSFNFDVYVVTGQTVNEYGLQTRTYSKQCIRGSLQSRGTSLSQDIKGTTTTQTYNFYCKSLYRLNIGDIIVYKHNYLMCVSVQDYDEYGVREAVLEVVQLTSHRDLAEYIKYLEGEKLV